MKLIPLTDKIIVRRDIKENKTDSGIYLGETREQIYFGTVVSVGDGKVLDNGTIVKPRLKKGDKVCWSFMQGTLIQLDGQDYYIIVEDGIFAKIQVSRIK